MNITIFGNGGEVVINDLGTPIEQRPSSMVPHEHDGYADITRFDVDEWRAFYGRDLPGSLDILDIGYWCGSLYEPAEPEHRAHVVEGGGSMVISASVTKMLGGAKE